MFNFARLQKFCTTKLAIAAVIAIGIVPPPAALAWNPYGHMVVAYIGWQNMNAEAREKASKLLKLNPYYDAWKKHIGETKSADELNMKIFMMASTWPDAIKGDTSYISDGSEGGFRPKGPSASQNTGYDDKQLHKYWHFYDEPFSNEKNVDLPNIPAPNSETQMEAFRKVIASDAPDTLKSYDLTWIIHLVGDIHQPLHGVTRITEKHPHGDNGGNLVKLTCPDCPPRFNLHYFWDGALGNAGAAETIPDPNMVIETASHLHKANKKSVRDLTVDDWVHDSFNIAKKSIYKPLQAGEGPFQLDEKYKSRAKVIAKKQGELAGERLARLLNEELK